MTTSSVLGLCFDGGVLLAGDLGGSYGKMLRFENCPRIKKINEFTMIAVSGDYADYQYLESIIDAKMIDEERLNDGFKIKPKSMHSWLTRVLHNRRNKFDPLWTNIIVAGMQDGKPYLGAVDKLGSAFETHLYATGFGNYMGLGLMREAYESKQGKLTKDEAVKAMKDVLRVLYYRDCLAYGKFMMGICTSEGTALEGPFQIDSNWEVAKYIQGY